jgi:hypothetical protein
VALLSIVSLSGPAPGRFSLVLVAACATGAIEFHATWHCRSNGSRPPGVLSHSPWQRHCRLCLTRKGRSGCCGSFGERDGVAEAFELFDEALGLALGVSLGEVVGAEVAVGLAGGRHLPDRGQQ